MPQISWPRAVTTGILSALMTPISWGVTLFATPGSYMARLLVPEGSEWISNESIETAAAIDFAIWFTFLWGLRGLWVQFCEAVRERGVVKQWVSPLRHTAVPVNAVLCALPLSYYVVFSIAVLFNKRMLPDSTSMFVGAILVSLVASVAAIIGLFTVTVRFWPESWVPRGSSDNSKVTTLNLR